MIHEDELASFETFSDILSTTVIAKLSPETGKKTRAVKGRKNEIKPVAPVIESESSERLNDVAELSDFVEVCTLNPVLTSLLTRRVVPCGGDILISARRPSKTLVCCCPRGPNAGRAVCRAPGYHAA